MIDRYGKPINVAWPEHHLEWVRAALTLDFKERQAAFHDIAEMTGRGIEAVRGCVKAVRDRDRRQAIAYAHKKALRTATPALPFPPSTIRPPTMAQLMGCR